MRNHSSLLPNANAIALGSALGLAHARAPGGAAEVFADTEPGHCWDDLSDARDLLPILDTFGSDPANGGAAQGLMFDLTFPITETVPTALLVGEPSFPTTSTVRTALPFHALSSDAANGGAAQGMRSRTSATAWEGLCCN